MGLTIFPGFGAGSVTAKANNTGSAEVADPCGLVLIMIDWSAMWADCCFEGVAALSQSLSNNAKLLDQRIRDRVAGRKYTTGFLDAAFLDIEKMPLES